MGVSGSGRAVDVVLFVTANLVNLLISGVLLSRVWNMKRLERRLGLASVAMALPMGLCVTWNAVSERGLWKILLPVPLVRLLTQPLCDMVLVFKGWSRLTARARPGIPTFRFEPPDSKGTNRRSEARDSARFVALTLGGPPTV